MTNTERVRLEILHEFIGDVLAYGGVAISSRDMARVILGVSFLQRELKINVPDPLTPGTLIVYRES